jgi:hypothetical protein
MTRPPAADPRNSRAAVVRIPVAGQRRPGLAGDADPVYSLLMDARSMPGAHEIARIDRFGEDP